MANIPKNDIFDDMPTSPEEEQLFTSLRVEAWDEFHGQSQVKQSLQVAIEAARQREEALEHTLLYGPPGLGKTTLSNLISKSMGSQIHIASATTLTKVGDVAAILTSLQPNDIFFIDEIHRLPRQIEETLYPVMEDFALDVVLGKGPSARVMRLDLPPFTLVGATTKYGSLAAPFRDRFGLVHRVKYYEPEELIVILQGAGEKLGVKMREDVALALARRSRGTPRIALKLLKRVRDIAQLDNSAAVENRHLKDALALQQIDEDGLDEHDRRYIEVLKHQFHGGPVGLQTLAAALSEDALTLEEVVEPYLMQIGKIKRTARGRMIV
ncbi:Holliday junction branch migration DNA helicase RuvB [Candidatus Woesebacteria bacterium]|nr:Holliday junction branch migration DNA helicase RuvB [Candidatus Woesebacteria bacterium]MCD8527464.1 Holliday junction branch migration DNA helicase RuvB [Candidatus Woesebacteria bacterium]MCD8546206.1 Holliday junction branch migration DNA helicase RuvB [Candidatus Woesebacteria bacterium]